MKTSAKFGLAVITAVILLLLFSGTYWLLAPKQKSPEIFTYNHFTFTKSGGMWITEWQRDNKLFSIPLRFHPGMVKNVSVSGSIPSLPSKIIVSFDSEAGEQRFVALAAGELGFSVGQALNIPLEAACSSNVSGCESRRILSCDTPHEKSSTLIFLKEEENTSITVKDNCVLVAGNNFELIKAVDRLLYYWYGMME